MKLVRFLSSYESQLATYWALWVRALRILRLVSNSSAKNMKMIFHVERMYRHASKFWSTNKQKYLLTAFNSYFYLRGQWLDSLESAPARVLISGWVDNDSLLELSKLLPEYRIKRNFRPDVWYLTGGKLGWLNGFEIKVPLASVETIVSRLKSLEGNVEVLPLKDNVVQTDAVACRIESITALRSEAGANWFATYSVDPKLFTWLVESAVDIEIANRAIKVFKNTPAIIDHSVDLFCILKFYLISEQEPVNLEMHGWELFKIEDPNWIPSDLKTEETTEGLRPHLKMGYTNIQNLGVFNGGIILSSGAFLNWDPAQHPSLDFVAGNHEFVVGTPANLNYCFLKHGPRTASVDCGIVLASRADFNWFHFLIETLPRLLVLDNSLDSSIPVLVSDRVPQNGIEALKLLSSRPIILLDTSVLTRVKNAYLPSPIIYHPDTQFLWGKFRNSDVNQQVLRMFRSIVLNRISTKQLPESLYWIRSSRYRNIANQKSVENVAKGFGFEVQDPGVMGFVDQISSINSRKNVLAVGGALMSNFIFAKQGSRIFLLVSKMGKEYVVPKILASIAEAHLIYIGGRQIAPGLLLNIVQKSHLSFRVNTKKLSRILRDSITGIE